MDEQANERTERRARRRDAAGLALSAATLAVLAVGVLVIRSTRTERPTPASARAVEESLTAPEGAGVESPTQPEVILALPTPPAREPAAPPATAERYGAETIDRR